MRLTVMTSGPETIVSLSESILVTRDKPTLLLKKATIFWLYENIPKGETVHYALGNSMTILDNGYQTFKMLKDSLESHDGVKLEAIKSNGRCKLTNSSKDHLFISKTISKLLGGFSSPQFPSKKFRLSSERVNVNLGLECVSISCSIVDRSHNINTKGEKSGVVTSLAIPTDQPLYGSVQHFSDIESRVAIDKGVINQIVFSVTDQDGKPINIGKILLELYIT